MVSMLLALLTSFMSGKVQIYTHFHILCEYLFFERVGAHMMNSRMAMNRRRCMYYVLSMLFPVASLLAYACMCACVWNLTLLFNAIQFRFYYSKVWRTLFSAGDVCTPYTIYIICVRVFVCLNKSHIINTFFFFCAKTAVPVVEAMNLKWKLCDTFVVCNVKRWWQQWQQRWKCRRSQREKKSERKCEYEEIVTRRLFRFMWFHYTFFPFYFRLVCLQSTPFLPQAKVAVVINSCSHAPQKKATEKETSDLNWASVLCVNVKHSIQMEKHTMRDLIKRLKKTARIKMVNHFEKIENSNASKQSNNNENSER